MTVPAGSGLSSATIAAVLILTFLAVIDKLESRAVNRTVMAYGRTPTGQYGWVADHHPYHKVKPHTPVQYGMGCYTAENGCMGRTDRATLFKCTAQQAMIIQQENMKPLSY